MSRILWAFIGACVVTVGVSAQAYPEGQGQDKTAPTTQAPAPPAQVPATRPTTPPPSASAAVEGKKMTFSGCIERQPASAAAVTGAPSMPFTLAKASEVGSTSAVATTGTATTAATATKSYRLDGAESMLAPHVGHKVEITGTVEDQPTSASAGGTASGSSATAAAKVKVDSVKMVSTTCS